MIGGANGGRVHLSGLPHSRRSSGTVVDRLATSTSFSQLIYEERYPTDDHGGAVFPNSDRGRPDDALAILEVKRSAIRQTASPGIVSRCHASRQHLFACLNQRVPPDRRPARQQ
jgi:hypothetical protein